MKKYKTYVVVIAAFMVFCGCAAGSKVAMSHGGESVRVLISDSKQSVIVEGAKGKKTLKYSISSGSELEESGKTVGKVVRVQPDKYLLTVDGKSFRGVIELRAINGKITVIDELPVEAYVVGIINNEISSKWPIEAIKAQAVVSRTYVLYQKEKRKGALYDVAGTVMDQVYTGASKEDSASSKAVKATEGQVLLYDGEPILAVFHSNAGGMTESSVDVWSEDHPYLKPVKSKYDDDSGSYEWELSVSDEELEAAIKKAGFDVEGIDEIEVDDETSSGRAKLLSVTDKRGRTYLMTGEELRKTLGYSKLKSTLLDKVKHSGGATVFKGRGSGHGVGMSQWGAKGMADRGYKYKDILEHYYQGTKLKKIY